VQGCSRNPVMLSSTMPRQSYTRSDSNYHKGKHLRSIHEDIARE